MSLVWDYFNIGGSEKLVLLAMADWCNDTGGSLYPSISAIAKKTCSSESQARRVLHSLINKGYVSVVGNFSGGAQNMTRRYQIELSRLTPSADATPTIDATPSASATPSVDATPSASAHIPLAPMRVTPSIDATPPLAPMLPKPPVLPLNIKGTINNAHAILATLGIDKQIASDWIILRKQKKAAVTETAMQGIQREADKAGLSLEAVLRVCCERGWSGFKAEWMFNGNGKHTEHSVAQAREGAREMLFGKNAKTIVGG